MLKSDFLNGTKNALKMRGTFCDRSKRYLRGLFRSMQHTAGSFGACVSKLPKILSARSKDRNPCLRRCSIEKKVNFLFFLARRSKSAKIGLTAGFSLVELVVAVAIFVILTVTLLFNYGNFDRRVTVDILAHQIATWVHDTQVSAMSIRRSRTGVTASEQFRSGYGLHFDMATPNKFTYFADLIKNRTYDPSGTCGSPSVECEQEVLLLKGNVVLSLCGDQPALGQTQPNCVSATTGTLSLYTTNTLDIVFMRPDPFTASIWGDAGTIYSHAEITVSSPKGYRHTITVWTTGQVSVR